MAREQLFSNKITSPGYETSTIVLYKRIFLGSGVDDTGKQKRIKLVERVMGSVSYDLIFFAELKHA